MDCSIEKLIPHASPMVLIDSLVAHDTTSVIASLTIQKDSPFFEINGVPSYISIEYMAQTIALWKGLSIDLTNEPSIGFLLGTRKLVLNRAFFREDETLLVYGELLCNVDQLGSFKCYIKSEDQIVAEAIVNVYQPENAIEFLRTL